MAKLSKSEQADVLAHRAPARVGKLPTKATVKTSAPANKAVVLGATQVRGGQYLVLAPASAPKHVSAAKLASAVRRVVAAR